MQKTNRAISSDYMQLHGYYGSIKCSVHFSVCVCLVVLFWKIALCLSFVSLLFLSCSRSISSSSSLGIIAVWAAMVVLMALLDIAMLPSTQQPLKNINVEAKKNRVFSLFARFFIALYLVEFGIV